MSDPIEQKANPLPQSQLETFAVSDFLEWHRSRRLDLNPHFQRRSVWNAQAKTMLIDTILRGFPIPKVYIRSKIDTQTQIAYREVVDGQQRLRAILDFASNKLTLGRRANEFAGLTYDELSDSFQQTFLSYTVAVEHLFNASDEDVLEIFSRLNSYTVPLNGAETRHATYQGEFKWAVHEASKRHSRFWDEHGIFTPRTRLRMADDALLAECYGILLRGVGDGGARALKQLYQDYDSELPNRPHLDEQVDLALSEIDENFGEIIIHGSPLARPPHFLMVFAAVAHAKVGISIGAMHRRTFPDDRSEALRNVEVAIENLEMIADLISEDRESVPRTWRRFHTASRSSTHRLASRRVRFPIYFRALLPQRFAPV